MNGVINFLKPPGMTSNGAVVFLRGLLGVKKTGHAGTLDPGACGVLPICVGKATKISAYMMGGQKEYIAEITFGKRTDTADSYGTLLENTDAPLPSENDVKHVLPQFVGTISQQAPAYSAVKHEGRALYKLARKGIAVAPKVRNVDIHDIHYIARMRDDAHLIRVRCGKGTYIRTLCEDIAAVLGTIAYMSFLVRTQCAGLDIETSVTADELKQMSDRSSVLLPMDRFLGSLPETSVHTSCRKILFNGGSIKYDGGDGDVRVYIGEEFLGIGAVGDGGLRIKTLLVDE